jgi:hypothetical protein
VVYAYLGLAFAWGTVLGLTVGYEMGGKWAGWRYGWKK